ncbi:SatD family protein [Croceitalea rosinachiae]|uniref:SatD family protein n=1 Tax=Croceitalea rosinachiae TaxID=3075596 RepID=A0ABU3AC39_9FLAO|nr:SatD family protein [Croceitalea sp. F388]MDT0607544.1 SatD family protein [Croceitalea sp. F388]
MEQGYNIIMADIISSRQINKKDDFMRQFKELTHLVNDEFKNQILSPLTITLGDEFQGIVKGPKSLFELLFFLEESIIANQYPFKLRYSLVYGEIDTKINEEIAYEMYGPGLTMAREALKTLKETGDNYFIHLNSTKDVQLSLCMKLYQSIKSDWKNSDYKIISAFLENDDYKNLKKMGLYKTRSGPWKKRKTLRIEEYNIIKNIILNIL